jgi:hypothetical protein
MKFSAGTSRNNINALTVFAMARAYLSYHEKKRKKNAHQLVQFRVVVGSGHRN